MIDASPPIIVLAVVALVSCIVAWRRSMQETKAWRGLVDWLRTHRAEVWDAMPRADRFLSRGAIDRLYRGDLVEDAEFRRRVEEMRALPSVLPPLLAGAAAIVALLSGSYLFGWTW